MTFPPVEGACAFVWRNYMLVHSGVSDNDGMRGALHRYVSDLYEAGKYDFDVLQAAAVVYLKKTRRIARRARGQTRRSRSCGLSNRALNKPNLSRWKFGSKTMKFGPFSFWVISPFTGIQLWTYYCVLNPSGLPALAIELAF